MKFDIKNKQNISKDCFVCGIENSGGLRAKFYETTSDEVIGVFTPDDKFQSYPNILHGGISATILDETIGRAIMLEYGQDTFGVTAELNIRYRKPVPLNEEIKVIARITNDRKKLFEGSGEILLSDGTVAVSAKGKYMKKEIDKIIEGDYNGEDWIASDAKDLETITIG